MELPAFQSLAFYQNVYLARYGDREGETGEGWGRGGTDGKALLCCATKTVSSSGNRRGTALGGGESKHRLRKKTLLLLGPGLKFSEKKDGGKGMRTAT